jgi:probable rRNA maturation factor
MRIEIIVSTPCRAWLTDLPEAVDIGQKTVAAVLTDAGLTGREIEVGVTLTDDEQMRQLNKDYRQADKATNVLSFAGDGDDDPAPGDPQIPLLLGDIVLAHGVVTSEARDQNKSLHDHFCHLLVHGTLHLLGLDHLDEDEAQTMETREVAILARMGVADPYLLADQCVSLDLT